MIQNGPKMTQNGPKYPQMAQIWRPDLRTFSANFVYWKSGSANFFAFRMYASILSCWLVVMMIFESNLVLTILQYLIIINVTSFKWEWQIFWFSVLVLSFPGSSQLHPCGCVCLEWPAFYKFWHREWVYRLENLKTLNLKLTDPMANWPSPNRPLE